MTPVRHPVRPIPALFAGILAILWLVAGGLCIDHCRTSPDSGDTSALSAKPGHGCCHKSAATPGGDEAGDPGSCRILALSADALDLSTSVATLPSSAASEPSWWRTSSPIPVSERESMPPSPLRESLFRTPELLLGPACRSTAPPFPA